MEMVGVDLRFVRLARGTWVTADMNRRVLPLLCLFTEHSLKEFLTGTGCEKSENAQMCEASIHDATITLVCIIIDFL